MSGLLEKAREYERRAAEKESSLRPVYHFSNPVGWMNDPNGFSEYKGEHHLFYQYYPYATHWDSMHWGHAKSRDFIQWEYLPAALAPDEKYDSSGIFSGSALEDGEKQVLIYTGVMEAASAGGEKVTLQQQCVAVGDGMNYEKLSANPVITAELLPEGSSQTDFRDPKIWKEEDRYFVAAASRSGDGSGQIALFYSEDLRNWKLGSILDRSENKLGGMWECPDFFPLGDKHILMTCPLEMEAVGLEFHNGNNVAFLLGEYEKETMRFSREGVQNADYGLDFYAPQTMLAEDGRRILIGWMQSWDNPMYPVDFAWSGMMTIPRELTLRDDKVYQEPVRELEDYYKNMVQYSDVCVEGETALEGIKGRAVDLRVDIKGGDYGKCKIELASDGRLYSEIIYDREEGILTFDRTYSGHKKDTISTRSMRVSDRNGVLKLRILLDRYSVEIFVNEGEKVMTSLIYTPQSAEDITFFSSGKAYMDVKMYEIEAGRK